MLRNTIFRALFCPVGKRTSKAPLSLCQGLLRSPPSGTYPLWLNVGHFLPRLMRLQSQEWLMGSKVFSAMNGKY